MGATGNRIYSYSACVYIYRERFDPEEICVNNEFECREDRRRDEVG